MNAVEIESVTKTFGSVLAVDHLSLQVPEGCVYGFIGPNGSGKTTTLRMLLNIFEPDSGSVVLFSEKTLKSRDPRIGYLPKERGLYRRMKVRDLLCFLGELRSGRPPVAEVDRWLAHFELADWGGRKIETLSKGMALTGSAIYLVGALLALVQLGAVGYFPFHLLPWFFVYTVLAILMIGANSLALGALCNDPRDAQNLTLPSILPLMIPMFVLGPILKEPHSSFATLASLFPPFTPTLMMLRQSVPAGVPAWQPWLGLAGMLVFTTLLVFAASRVFRIGLLLQGKRPKFSEVMRWAIRG